MVNADPDFCECCGKVEVFDGKVCRECEERINRALAGAIDNFDNNMYNEELSTAPALIRATSSSHSRQTLPSNTSTLPQHSQKSGSAFTMLSLLWI